MKKIVIIILMFCIAGSCSAVLTGTEGFAIDLASAGAGTDFTIAFDPTEFLGSRIWGDGSTDTIVWTWNRATGTDPTMTFNDGGILFQTLTAASLVGPLTGNADTVTTNANLTGEVTSVGNAAVIIESFLEDGGASEIAVTAGMMNTGTNADGTTFWRGDNTWVIPASGDAWSDAVDSDILPTGNDNTFDLGSVAASFKDMFWDGTATGNVTGDLTGNADTVTNATFTTALTVDTGTLTLTADAGNNSVLTIGANGVSVSGANTGDDTGAAGDIYTNVHDFGGATSIEIPNGTDPDVDAVGEISNDTDGGNETGDVSLRGYDGANQFLWTRKLKTLNFTLISPSDIAAKDFIPIWHNNTGMEFTVVEWKAWSDTDDVLLDIETVTGTNYTARTTVDAVTIATNLTGVFFGTDTTITSPIIAADSTLAIDFGATDPEYVQIAITGWFNSDVD